MVSEEVFDAHGLGDGVFLHRDASRSGEIILGDLGTCQFAVRAYEVGGYRACLNGFTLGGK